MSKLTRVKAVTADQLLVNPEKLCSAPAYVLEQGVREIQRELWVRKWYKKAQSYRASNRLGIMYTGLYTTVTIIYHDRVTPYVGWSKCSPIDRYDDRVGVAVATARALGEQIPDYI